MAPLGQYNTDRYLNLGANRWGFKPELGLVQPIGRKWALEGYAGVWLFGHNTEFLDTATVTQDPVWTFQGHVIRILGRRGYLALDGKAAWAFVRGHALKAVFSTGVMTRFGGDFKLFSVGYQYHWGR